jgi:hypothetical protein
VVRKFKTTEEELAKMLLRLYRAQHLTKEEFNDFFKGVALRPKPAPSAAPPAAPEDEAPSVLVDSLAREAAVRREAQAGAATVVEKPEPPAEPPPKKPAPAVEPELVEEIAAPVKPAPVAAEVAPREEKPPVSEAVTEEMPAPPRPPSAVAPAEEPAPAVAIEAEAYVTADIEVDFSEEPVPSAREAMFPEAAKEEVEAIVAAEPFSQTIAEEEAPQTQADRIFQALDAIVATLRSIDARLAEIEKRSTKSL